MTLATTRPRADLFAALLLTLSLTAMTDNAQAACAPLLNHTFSKLQDKSPQPLCQYQGKVVLVVNTASY